MARYLGLAGALALASACECGERSTAPSPVSAPADPATPEEEPSTPAQTEAQPAADRGPRVAAARAGEVRAAIREGRRAARESRWDDALAAFDRATQILPGAPRVRCEAGYVAHRAGQHRRAARELDIALALLPDASGRVPADLRVPLAMCLYNRGLVHEALDQPARAGERYEESLELRENATVRARLAAIEDRELREEAGLGPGASLADVESFLEQRYCAEPCDAYEEDDEDEDDEDDENDEDADRCSHAERLSPEEGEQWPEDVAFFAVTSEGCGFDLETLVGALRGPTGWRTWELGQGETATTDSFFREEASYSYDPSAHRLAPNLLRIDVVEVVSARYGDEVPPPEGVEDDPGCLADHDVLDRSHTVVLCRTDGAVRCGSLLVGRDGREAAPVVMCPSNEIPAWAQTEETDEELPDEIPDRLVLSLEGGAVVIAHGPGTEPLGEHEPAPGRYELDALFTDVLRRVDEDGP